MFHPVLSLSCLLTAPVFAQAESRPPSPPDEQPAQTMTIGQIFEQIQRAEPVRRAGLRADLIRRTQQVVPAVVIVRDERSFLAAIAAWEGPRRFPVLWDDGSVRAQEDIARFVRAFKPTKVFRLEGGADAPAWPQSRGDREVAFKAVLTKAADESAPDFESVLRVLRAGGVTAPGIVITDTNDKAWPAALALAAARYQPVGFVINPSGLVPALTTEQADRLEEAAQNLAIKSGLTWREIGDDIDAVTLCLNTGARIKFGNEPRDYYATSARVGRFGANGSGQRWANTGQIFGSHAEALYRAMCPIFLTPRDAFIFDGYEATQPWVTYSGKEASGALKDFGFETQLHERPGNTTDIWLALTARPIRQGLWLINSHGNAPELNFPGGAVRGSNTPMMEQPVLAHVVHSFSLQSPWNRNTVGGSILDRGAYAMLGSVDEPYLQAFVPTPVVAKRLAAGLNFAAAVRFDDAPVWKLAVMGDPLITLGPPGSRLEDTDLALSGQLDDLDDELSAALKERDLAGAATILTLLGRDADAARLAMAVMGDETIALTPELAAAAIPALYRNGHFEEVVTAYANTTEKLRDDPILADCFWFAGRFLLGSSRDRDRVERLMRVFPRPGSRVYDAEEMALRARSRSVEDAVLVLESVRSKLTQNWEIQALEQALERVRRNAP